MKIVNILEIKTDDVYSMVASIELGILFLSNPSKTQIFRPENCEFSHVFWEKSDNVLEMGGSFVRTKESIFELIIKDEGDEIGIELKARPMSGSTLHYLSNVASVVRSNKVFLLFLE